MRKEEITDDVVACLIREQFPEWAGWGDPPGRARRLGQHDFRLGDEMTEEEARRRLVPSKTTLLGLVKHATFVEGVWFDQAVTGRSYAEIGIARTVDGSFMLHEDDTIATVRAAYGEQRETSRRNRSGLRSDDRVRRRGDRPVWALQLQVLRELAQHAGHADILREQILASRSPTTSPARLQP